MGRKTPDFPEYPEWSTARFWGFLRSVIRQGWSKWPPKYKALKRQTVPYKGPDKRRKKSIVCEACGGEFKQSDIQVHHIEPVGQLKDFEDLPEFVRKMFVHENKLQCLCKQCHKDIDNKHTF